LAAAVLAAQQEVFLEQTAVILYLTPLPQQEAAGERPEQSEPATTEGLEAGEIIQTQRHLLAQGSAGKVTMAAKQ
jgi:hypothetical protein